MGEKSVVPSVLTLVVLTQIPLLWLLISKENYHLSFSTCKMGFMVSQNDMLTVMLQREMGIFSSFLFTELLGAFEILRPSIMYLFFFFVRCQTTWHTVVSSVVVFTRWYFGVLL